MQVSPVRLSCFCLVLLKARELCFEDLRMLWHPLRIWSWALPGLFEERSRAEVLVPLYQMSAPTKCSPSHSTLGPGSWILEAWDPLISRGRQVFEVLFIFSNGNVGSYLPRLLTNFYPLCFGTLGDLCKTPVFFLLYLGFRGVCCHACDPPFNTTLR